MSRETDAQWDTILRTLADDQRRRVYRRVVETDRPTSLDEIARHLIDDADADGLAYVRARLYHVHLPKLADAGLVSWDGGDRISRGAFSDHLSADVASPPSAVRTEGLGRADD
jgi:DNA-binding transcriptional ArsR family regulator